MSARVALVTGASKGLGAEVALALGREGYRVVAAYHKDREGAESVVRAIGGGSRAVGMDVSSEREVEGLAENIRSLEGRLDLLVNNAGITLDSLIVRTAPGDWERVMRVNLVGCANSVRACASLMSGMSSTAGTGGGHVINVSSRSGVIGKAGQAAYSASKAALVGLTMEQAAELAGDNIRVNAIVPGYMPTAMGREAAGAMERAKGDSLLGILADPEEAASFVVWLASTERITGQVFTLDSRIGGWGA
ncbi:MAG: SDR family oxidoreductase [Thermodesulfovibrionales bacterium]|nr:SDR family oxidoreductase [Thermodesulfovibrionales bacterium]